MKILVTGGCGFIGSHFIRLVLQDPINQVVNLDALSYAGNPENLKDVERDPRYVFVVGSITDKDLVARILGWSVVAIVNFAAESHVDRSIEGAASFVEANVRGTLVLLEAAKAADIPRFLQVSTDEVYGSLPAEGFFLESTPLHPNNPYAATKASADLLVQAYAHTFGLDTVITRSSNNYGPNQYPEKFIPLFVANAIEGKPLPLYGDGLQIRDWLHVQDNCRGILAALKHGRRGQVYNIGGGNERPNLETARLLLAHLGRPESLIKFVTDRPGHDRRYAIDCAKAKTDLGWAPRVPFEKGLRETIDWYRSNGEWIRRVRTGEFRAYYERTYGNRGTP